MQGVTFLTWFEIFHSKFENSVKRAARFIVSFKGSDYLRVLFLLLNLEA